MESLSLAIMAVSCIVCFVVGAKVGQTVAKGKEIEMPRMDPLGAYREHRESKEARKEQERWEAIMRNIDNFDGTSIGQEDIPGR